MIQLVHNMKIIMLGPPGSGKGTVSEKLEKDFGWFHLSPGELLREEVKKGTTIGKEIKKYIEKGDLVPDQFVVEMVKLEIKDKKDYILDGFPRTLGQAKEIHKFGIDLVLFLDVPEDEVIIRLSGRRICPKCDANFHIKYIPSKEEGKCDDCGGKLIRRKDDKPESVKERFKVYYEKTQPLIDFFTKKGILKKVDGAPAPDIVYAEVKKLVKKFKK